MKNITIIIACLLFALHCYPQEDTQSTTEKMDGLIKKPIAENKFVGVSAAVAVDGKTIWAKAEGMSNKKEGIPFSATTKTRIASIAKPITAVAVLQLVEKGLIELDEPIQNYIMEFPKPDNGTITTRQILQHTSGIKHYKSAKETETKKHYKTLTQAMNVFADRKLNGTPGENYEYTTYGYVVLGVLIERVSNMTYEEYVRINIFNPLGMNDTGIEEIKKSYNNKSALYHRRKKGKIKTVKKANDLSNRIPGGGFYSTAEDLLKFGIAVLNHQLINEKTTAEMFHNPQVRNPEEGNGYGMGWFLYGLNDLHGPIMGHSGGQTGCSSQLMLLPESKMVVVVLANTSGAWEDAFMLNVKLFHSVGPKS